MAARILLYQPMSFPRPASQAAADELKLGPVMISVRLTTKNNAKHCTELFLTRSRKETHTGILQPNSQPINQSINRAPAEWLNKITIAKQSINQSSACKHLKSNDWFKALSATSSWTGGASPGKSLPVPDLAPGWLAATRSLPKAAWLETTSDTGVCCGGCCELVDGKSSRSSGFGSPIVKLVQSHSDRWKDG